MESLTKDQVERLKALRRQMADEQLTIVYDNTVDNKNHQCNGITGLWREQLVANQWLYPRGARGGAQQPRCE
jgi:hypothetical protein